MAYLNTLTDYSDNGFLKPIDWTKAHEDPTNNPAVRPSEDCANYVKIEGGKFVSVFGEPGKPWVCFAADATNLDDPIYRNFASGS